MYKFPVPNVYQALDIVMKYYPNKFTEQARVEVETLLDHCLISLEENSEKFLTTLFLKALKKHIGPGSIDEHIYLKKYSLPQITLFDIIIKQFPFVKNSHEITNNLLYQKMRETESAVLMDIGIGRGIQTLSLIEMFKPSDKLRTLKVVGIEPFTEAIELTEKILTEKAKQLHFELEFIGINALIEAYNFTKIKELVKPDEPIFINTSLTLHHIKEKEERKRVLSELRTLNPKALLLTEPNVNHYDNNFHKRFQNSYQHFFHVFSVIDKLDVDANAKSSLKLFFGREIEDIIGKKDKDRYERHDLATNWVDMLTEANYTMETNYTPEFTPTKCGVIIEHVPEKYLGFRHEEETVLAVIYAKT